MFFDRYEIHIQAFVDFINGKFIISRSSSSQNHCMEIGTQIKKKYGVKHVTTLYQKWHEQRNCSSGGQKKI